MTENELYDEEENVWVCNFCSNSFMFIDVIGEHIVREHDNLLSNFGKDITTPEEIAEMTGGEVEVYRKALDSVRIVDENGDEIDNE